MRSSNVLSIVFGLSLIGSLVVASCGDNDNFTDEQRRHAWAHLIGKIQAGDSMYGPMASLVDFNRCPKKFRNLQALNLGRVTSQSSLTVEQIFGPKGCKVEIPLSELAQQVTSERSTPEPVAQGS